LRLTIAVAGAVAALATLSASLGAQSTQIEQAQKLFDSQKYAEAAQLITPIGKREAPAAFLLGKIALQQNDASKAVDWLEQAVELNPRSSEYYDWLGKAYGTQAEHASKLKQPFLARKTKAAWEKAMELDPKNIEARQDMIQYYLQAPGFVGGSKEKALATALEIKKLNPYRGAFVVVNVCTEMKDQACVETEIKSLISTYPDSSAAYSSLAAFYANAKQFEKAFAIVDGRLKAKPSDAAALYSFGRTASLSGQNLDRGEAALKAYIAAPLPNGPAVANAHYRLGMIAERRGAKDVARREYQTALSLNPNLQEVKKALAALGG
jgi:tetratricopeptide (TPR) repeat protein